VAAGGLKARWSASQGRNVKHDRGMERKNIRTGCSAGVKKVQGGGSFNTSIGSEVLSLNEKKEKEEVTELNLTGYKMIGDSQQLQQITTNAHLTKTKRKGGGGEGVNRPRAGKSEKVTGEKQGRRPSLPGIGMSKGHHVSTDPYFPCPFEGKRTSTV